MQLLNYIKQVSDKYLGLMVFLSLALGFAGWLVQVVMIYFAYQNSRILVSGKWKAIMLYNQFGEGWFELFLFSFTALFILVTVYLFYRGAKHG